MKQIALVLATLAALATPGAALAQRAVGAPPPAPAPHHPPVVQPHHPRHAPPPGHPGHVWRHRAPANGGWGGSIFMGSSGAPEGAIVTREFLPPRPIRPRAPTVEILQDKPVVFREPPHIIQVKRFKPRRPITVVRRGVLTRE